MHKILFIALLCYALLGDSYGFLGRVSIPLHLMPTATNDIFNWRMPDGSYQFGMQGQDQWRVEKRYPNGAVYVHFAYKTPDGKVHDQTITSGVPPKASIRDNVETEGSPTETKYEKFETSYSNSKDDSAKLSARNIASEEKQMNNPDVDGDDADGDDAKGDDAKGVTSSSKLKDDNKLESNFTVDDTILKTKKAINNIRPTKQSLLDNYIQKQRETEIPKSRSFSDISFSIQKPQKSSSTQVLPTIIESNTIKKYGNRRAKLGNLFKTNADNDFKQPKTGKKTIITLF